MSRSTYPEILKEIPIPILELLPFFHQIFKISILFLLYFKNDKRQMLSLNGKHGQHIKIYIPCNFEINLITHRGVIALFSSNFQNFNFVLYFKNDKRQMLSLNCKHVQHIKIYLPCNFKVNLITHLGVVALFSSIFSNVDTFRLIFKKL